MRYRILGRIDVYNGEAWSPLPAAKQRALLGHLLIHANRFVSADALITELWGEQVPPSAAKSLQVYVHRLRRAIGNGDEDGTLLTRPGGYELAVAPGALDAERFTALADTGRTALADRRPDAAVDALTRALDLWRGRALADVPPTPSVLAEAARMEENRLAAWQDLADAKLAAGRHEELAAELHTLLAEQPLREPLWAKLMLALHRSGRRSDALQAYATARRTLLDELGVEPGAELREVYRTVLGGETPPERPRSAVGCQLPARVPDFTGRRQQLTTVLGLLHGEPADAPRMVVVTGVAGAGKSSFAVHAAHLLRESFPDGQLYADLRSSTGRPLDPGEVLAALLKTLGVTGAALPATPDERARRYRAELADRRALVVLDNAVSERQLRPLLPGTGDSAVLITSRGGLAGLEGALRVGLGLLPEPEALALLARAVGDDRTRKDAKAAARITRQCGHLPLALRIAGARLATRPHLSAARLADALADERRRLDELVAGDLEVRASVSLSYEALPPPARRALRMLGLLDVPTVPGWVLGALLDGPYDEGERALDTLLDNHLVEVAATDIGGEPRFRLHDLVRLYAHEQAAAEDPAACRAAAVRRVGAAYLDLARAADTALAAGFAGPVPDGAYAWAPPAAVRERVLAAPQDWFDAERTTLCALVRQAPPDLAWRLAASLANYLEAAAHFDDWRDTHETGLAAAASSGDLLGEAVMHRNLGELLTVQDRYGAAVASFKRSLRAYAARGRPEPGEGAAAAGLGVLLRLRGRYGEAAACLDRGIAAARIADNPRAAAYAHGGLGTVLLERGEAAAARREFGRALSLSRTDGYTMGEYAAERCLGLAALAAGELDASRRHLETALVLASEQGNRVGEIHALQWLGHLDDVGGDTARADATLAECLTAYRRFGERFGEALTLRAQADLWLHAGRRAEARTAVQQSLSIWRRLDSPYWTARTLDVLAAVHATEGGADAEIARLRAARQATSLRAAVGLPAGLRAATVDGRALGGHLTQLSSPASV
ncbi:tetratricopeptide repeat protein [Streptomyces sp. A7024]|uniref:Tetratricopeptide repeat protein n=1 Tax=Streptomyces coryli TaxID=1128680 RepID=A0A6G4UB32_9ACTN|nr:tetratricopeptide repeat protein [Streptomyces coryli]